MDFAFLRSRISTGLHCTPDPVRSMQLSDVWDLLEYWEQCPSEHDLLRMPAMAFTGGATESAEKEYFRQVEIASTEFGPAATVNIRETKGELALKTSRVRGLKKGIRGQNGTFRQLVGDCFRQSTAVSND